jgi:hypothetical protein
VERLELVFLKRLERSNAVERLEPFDTLRQAKLNGLRLPFDLPANGRPGMALSQILLALKQQFPLLMHTWNSKHRCSRSGFLVPGIVLTASLSFAVLQTNLQHSGST